MNGPTHPANLPPKTDPLSREQRARAEALHTALAVLGSAGSRDAIVPDLIDLAAYVIDGLHPLARDYGSTAIDVLSERAATLSGEPTNGLDL